MCPGAPFLMDGTADAMVSAGNTGASMAAALLRIGRIRGVARPAIGVPIPVPGSTTAGIQARVVGSLDASGSLERQRHPGERNEQSGRTRHEHLGSDRRIRP